MRLIELTELVKAPTKHVDGNLVLNNHKMTWTLNFVQGQLLYAADELHAIRRWDRALKQHFPGWNSHIDAAHLRDRQFWQLYLLDQSINQQKLSLIRAKLVIRTISQECLFELSQCTNLNSNWQPFSVPISRNCRSIALSSWEMQMTLGAVKKMQQQWQDAGLEQLSPTLSPVLKNTAETQSLPVANQYLKGNFTLWDIARQLDKSLIEIVQFLLPSFKQGILEFKPISDLSLPMGQSLVTPPLTAQQPVGSRATQLKSQLKSQFTSSADQQPLIACIDDSPVLAYSLKKILVPAGYRMLSIQEPMRGFSQLIEHKPSLLLLDLLLPNADGYSICKFLRDTPVFEKTPIIILTGQNTPIDRARARLVGATEFLVKPPKPEELLQMIQKHLLANASV
ncbi:MAG: response regulator [Cyanothece sp. SIO1E1]|nr:response regulator [Cyanothece sp. SIO1E1]